MQTQEKYAHIPAELKALKQWVCWKWVENGSEKPRKMPVNPYTGKGAQSNNPDTWSDYETAAAYAEKNSLAGIGFMFANGYFGVDIDGAGSAVDEYKNGGTDNIIAEFIFSLQSYAEYSVSGNGLHVICRGTLPPGGRRRGNVEMYQEGRFFIMTGNAASDCEEIKDCTEAIKPLHEKYIGGVVPGSEPVHRAAIQPIDISDNEIIEAALASKQGSAFGALYNGQWDTIFTSQSEADLSFCNMLAFWCRRDIAQMDRIFRSSGLMREKWDRKQSGTTYGAITLNKAISSCQNVYEPRTASAYSVQLNRPSEHRPIKPHTFDDTGNASRLLDRFGNAIRYNYVSKRWMYYDGRRWLYDYDGSVKRMVDVMLSEMQHERELYSEEEVQDAFDKHIKRSRSSKAKTALLHEAEHQVPIVPEKLDTQKDLLNTPCGIVNLRTGALLKHDRDKYLSMITNAEVTDTMDCPLWLDFLDTIFAGDAELIRYVQKAIGYSLTGSTKEQCAFFLYGDGKNGKSTFVNLLSDILGDYAVNIQPSSIMVKSQSGSATSDIARLRGARFVTSFEPNEGMRIDEGLLKQLTGGDRITASRKYENEFEFNPEFKLWMSMNHRPIIRGTDSGIWRRIKLIPFTVQIPDGKEDKTLIYKLKRESPAILKWAIDGCLAWQKEGLKDPESIVAATREYRGSMDTIGRFIEQCCITGTGIETQESAKALFDAYRRWADENNEYTMTATKFGVEMGKRFEKTRDMRGNVYKNICLDSSYRPYKLSVSA